MPGISINELQLFDNLDGSQVFANVDLNNTITYQSHVSAIFYDNAVTENVLSVDSVTKSKIKDSSIDNNKIDNDENYFIGKLSIDSSSNQLRLNGLDYSFPSQRSADRYLYHNINGNLEWKEVQSGGGGTGAPTYNLIQNSMIPVGAVTQWASVDTPDGWLICNGGTFTSDDYPELAALLGSTYGPINGNTYRLPNFKGKVPVGLGTGFDENGNSQTFNIANSGGEYNHTLTVDEIPSHTHPIRDSNFSGTNRNTFLYGDSGGVEEGLPNLPDETGGGLAHNNLQPYLAVNYIIKARSDYFVNYNPTTGPGLSAADSDGNTTSTIDLSTGQIGLKVDNNDFTFGGNNQLKLNNNTIENLSIYEAVQNCGAITQIPASNGDIHNRCFNEVRTNIDYTGNGSYSIVPLTNCLIKLNDEGLYKVEYTGSSAEYYHKAWLYYCTGASKNISKSICNNQLISNATVNLASGPDENNLHILGTIKITGETCIGIQQIIQGGGGYFGIGNNCTNGDPGYNLCANNIFANIKITKINHCSPNMFPTFDNMCDIQGN